MLEESVHVDLDTRSAPRFHDGGCGHHREAPNVKHQRARATASRANGTISLRALRCMR